MFPKVIYKGFSRMSFPYLHLFESFISIAQQNRAAGPFVFVISFPCPADAIRMIQIIPLCAICDVFPGLHQLFNIPDSGHLNFLFFPILSLILVLGATKIEIKSTWITLFAHY